MASRRQEPVALRRGKQFHKEVQLDWLQTAKDGIPKAEKTIIKPSGRHGRIDVFVDVDDDEVDMVAVVEIKASDWDRMTLQAVKRNARRYANQIWNYIESQLSDDFYPDF